MVNIALLTCDANSALGDFATICLVRYCISFVVNLSEGVLYGVIYFLFEHKDIILSLDDNVGTPEDALHFGINFAVYQCENGIYNKFVEIFT